MSKLLRLFGLLVAAALLGAAPAASGTPPSGAHGAALGRDTLHPALHAERAPGAPAVQAERGSRSDGSDAPGGHAAPAPDRPLPRARGLAGMELAAGERPGALAFLLVNGSADAHGARA